MKRSLKNIATDIAYSKLGDKILTLTGTQKLIAGCRVRSSKRALLAGAKKVYEKGSGIGTFEDYKQALKKHWVSYTEYAKQYEFYKKNEEEREEYISRLKMASFYWRYAPGSAKYVFCNKTRFLKAFKKYIHRKWLFAPEASFEDFKQMVSSVDCIVKPCDGKLGQGIFKTYKDDEHKDYQKLYETCVNNRMLVEQCIEECDELKAFHPKSLNTLRVVTIANRERLVCFQECSVLE